jgi:hypothetical protein
MSENQKVKIYQGGYDGFGHQFEGTLRLLSLSINKKAQYVYDYKKNFSFDHKPPDSDILINYILEGLSYLRSIDTNYQPLSTEQSYNIIKNEDRPFNEILKRDPTYKNTIYLYDGVGSGQFLPSNFELIHDFKNSIPILRDAFGIKNKILPSPSYNKEYINVCCHIRLGDAVGTRQLDTDNLYNVIRYFQKQPDKYRVIIHSDESNLNIKSKNTIIYDKSMQVINVLSDFINSDILIINYSGLSIAAHFLGDPLQSVICPDKAGVTFKNRILEKCIPCSKFLSSTK